MMRYAAALFLLLAVLPSASSAALPEPPLDAKRAAVLVVCDDRQGSGAITDAAQGYVVTNGHIAIDPETRVQADRCVVGVLGAGAIVVETRYEASIEHAVFDEIKNLDFAVLKIGGRLTGPPTSLKELVTDEFAVIGSDVSVLGFPAGAFTVSYGTIGGFSRGAVLTNGQIDRGSSGGPAIDAGHGLIGVSTKVRFSIDKETGEETIIDYEMGDVLALIAWLDSFGPGTHDAYLNHRDHVRFHGLPYAIREETPACTAVVRTTVSSTVYCLLVGDKRLVFPNETTYFSWFSDYGPVRVARTEDIARFRLIGNVTFKAGTLVKITTDPKVYLVTDSIGTLRHVPSEQRAIQLFGADWASRVKDVPDEFFVNYRIGEPLL